MGKEVFSLKRKRLFSILFGLPPLLFALLYGGGYISQFVRNYKEWQNAGGTPGNGTSPAMPSFALSDCFEAVFSMPYGIIGILICVGVLALLVVMVMRMGYGDTGEYDKDRNFIYSRKGTYGTSGFMSEKEAEEVLDLTSSVKKHNGAILGTLNGKYVCVPEQSPLNKNMAVYGASGSMKTRAYCINRILQAAAQGESLIICDPKSEILRKTGGALKANGYEVRVFDLLNPDASFCYNPLAYVRDDKDVLRLIETLIQSTTPPGAQSTDPFWTKSETALLQALVLYLMHEAPPEEQNFSMIMEMLGSAQVKEDDEEYQSPLDILFERLEMRNPESIAVKQYAIYKQAAGKTAKSILISVGVRLAAFNLKQIANLTCTDELDLYSIGEKKVALFCCIPDADTSLNYLVGMIYSNLFQTLYYVADRKYHGKLPIPVHCIMDEWPNVALPDDFDKLLATMRSRAISCSIIIQNIAQMKALFKDSWESLIGNCDEFLYLGGNEKEGHKYVSELLGKETLDTNTYGQTKGRSGSYSVNFQQSGRELLTPDEVRLLDNRKAVLLVRGERPILDEKYDLHKHVNVKYTEDGGAPPYDYAKAPLSHEDVTIDTRRLDDYELLSAEEILGGEQSF